jgi:hypothetical protein
MCLKCREEVTNPLAQVNLIDDDFGIAFELTLFAINIRKEVCDVLKLFLSFFLKYEEKNSLNVLYLMLDQRFKSLCLMSSFIGCEQVVNIVEEYDRRSLYPMLLKCYYYVHSMVESKVVCANQIRNAKSDLDIFEQTPSTSELAIELVTRKMLIFQVLPSEFQGIQVPSSMLE